MEKLIYYVTYIFIFSFSASDLSIRSGSINITGGERHEVVRIIQHEDYDPNNSYDADIAIVEVAY